MRVNADLVQVWEAAMKAVEAEELNKQRLCDDLKCLVWRLSPWKFWKYIGGEVYVSLVMLYSLKL